MVARITLSLYEKDDTHFYKMKIQITIGHDFNLSMAMNSKAFSSKIMHDVSDTIGENIAPRKMSYLRLLGVIDHKIT